MLFLVGESRDRAARALAVSSRPPQPPTAHRTPAVACCTL